MYPLTVNVVSVGLFQVKTFQGKNVYHIKTLKRNNVFPLISPELDLLQKVRSGHSSQLKEVMEKMKDMMKE